MSDFSNPEYVLSVEDATQIITAAEQTAFEGFDALVIRRIIDPKIQDAIGRAHINVLFGFYSTRGANAQNVLNKGKMKENGLRMVKAALDYFEINTTSSGRNLGPNVITLSRLVCAYAHIVAQVIIHLGPKFRSVVPNSEIDENLLPLAFRFPQAPSLMAREDEPMFIAWKTWSARFSQIIWNKKSEEVKKKLAEDQESFHLAIRNSPLYTNENRLKIKGILMSLTHKSRGNTTVASSLDKGKEVVHGAVKTSSSSSSSTDIDDKMKLRAFINNMKSKAEKSEFAKRFATNNDDQIKQVREWFKNLYKVDLTVPDTLFGTNVLK